MLHPPEVLMHNLREKKTECPSAFKFSLSSYKKDKRLSSSLPYLVSHPAVFQIQFNHNHPIQSAHTLSFRPISPERKEAFFKLFRKGHSASQLITGTRQDYF